MSGRGRKWSMLSALPEARMTVTQANSSTSATVAINRGKERLIFSIYLVLRVPHGRPVRVEPIFLKIKDFNSVAILIILDLWMSKKQSNCLCGTGF